MAISRAPGFGLILDYFLFCNDSFRIAPPLTISGEEISLACRQVCALLDEVQRNTSHK
jgi:4-aminobutyrate aminotransferase-like enzyme